MREQWTDEGERLGEKDVHLVFSDSISQLFGSFIADSIPLEVECGESLYEKIKMGFREFVQDAGFTVS